MSRPHGRARVNPTWPEAFGVCDRCGFWYNRNDLQAQLEYAGTILIDTNRVVCDICLEIPNPNTMTIVLPPDPVPVEDPRGEPFAIDEA